MQDISSLPVVRRCAVYAGVILMMYMSAVHTMVMTTLMSPIVSQFGHLEWIPWATNSFLLASMGTMPVYGRLCDSLGARRVCFLACALFSLGSVACGLSASFWMLVLSRAVQGSGSSAMLTAGYVLFGQLFPASRRATALGVLGAACALAMFTGPGLGALTCELLSWHWAFHLCAPVTLLSATLLIAAPDPRSETTTGSFDWVGALLFLGGAVIVTTGFMRLTQVDLSYIDLIPACLGGVLLVLFIWYSRRRHSPYIAIELMGQRVIAISSIVGFLTGAIMFAFPYLTSVFVQGVQGLGASAAGRSAVPVSIGWIAGSLFCGSALRVIGLRGVYLLGVSLFLSALSGLLLPGEPTLTLLSLLTGLGLGLCLNASIYAAQLEAPASKLGAATSLINLIRILGGAWGGAIVSAAQLGIFTRRLEGFPSEVLRQRPEILLDAEGRLGLGEVLLPKAEALLEGSISTVAYSLSAAVLICLFIVLRAPSALSGESSVVVMPE